MTVSVLELTTTIVDFLHEHDARLMDVIDALFWGDPALLAHPQLRGERTSFTHDPRFPDLLRRLCNPPSTGGGVGKTVSGAGSALDDFAFEHTYDILSRELQAYGPTTVYDQDDIDITSVKDITLSAITDDVKAHAPRLFDMLCRLMETDRQRAVNQSKKPDTLAIVIINIVTYSRSWQRSKMQKMNALFLKASGVPTRVFDVLQSFGLSMSSSWVSKLFNRLCKTAQHQMRADVWEKPWFGLYDNVRFNLHVDSQRVYNQSAGVNCTALTVLVVPAKYLPALVERGLEMKQLMQLRLDDPDRTPYISWNDFSRPDERTVLHRFAVDRVVSVLWEVPALASCSHRAYPAIQSPQPVQQLAPRKVVYHMLGTVPIDEVSYEGNELVLEEFMRQTGYDSEDGRQKICAGYGIPFVGDLLSVKRVRGLQQLQAEDENSYDRKSYIDPGTGWFHVQMNLDRQTFLNHRGTVSSDGLAREINTLNRHGLSATHAKPEYHAVDEFLHHVFAASSLDCWLWITGSATIEDLVLWVSSQSDPDILLDRADTIVRLRQSSVGVQIMQIEAERRTAVAAAAAASAPDQSTLQTGSESDDSEDDSAPAQKRQRTADGSAVAAAPAPSRRGRKRKKAAPDVSGSFDDVLAGRIRLNRDLNLREVLRDRVRRGDVGALRLLIPRLAACFKGGGNGGYGNEMLEVFQWLEYECTPGMRDFMMENCWLVNTQGHQDSFLPTDQFQEHCNRHLREWQERCGANLSLDFIKKISPIIPILNASVEQMALHFALPYRSKAHKVPDATADITAMLHRFRLRHVNDYVEGRTVTQSAGRPKDNEAAGNAMLQNPQTLADWREEREVHRQYMSFVERLENPSLPIEYEPLLDAFAQLAID